MRALATFLVALLGGSLAAVATQLYVSPRLPVAAVEVPPLVGLSPTQARGILDPRGLRLVITEERPDARVAPGTLCEQKPLADSRLRRGDEVRVVLARASDTTVVPSLAGMTPEAARELVRKAQLVLGASRPTAHPTVAAGLIIGTQPSADAQVKLGTSLELLVSSGPGAIAVPKLRGRSLSSAKELLEKAGFVLGAIKRGSDDDTDSGLVIGQTPKAEEQAAPGSKIDLVVNE